MQGECCFFFIMSRGLKKQGAGMGDVWSRCLDMKECRGGRTQGRHRYLVPGPRRYLYIHPGLLSLPGRTGVESRARQAGHRRASSAGQRHMAMGMACHCMALLGRAMKLVPSLKRRGGKTQDGDEGASGVRK
jgi:hypothetical protein